MSARQEINHLDDRYRSVVAILEKWERSTASNAHLIRLLSPGIAAGFSMFRSNRASGDYHADMDAATEEQDRFEIEVCKAALDDLLCENRDRYQAIQFMHGQTRRPPEGNVDVIYPQAVARLGYWLDRKGVAL